MSRMCNKSAPNRQATWHTNLMVERYQLTQGRPRPDSPPYVHVILRCPNCGIRVAAEMSAQIVLNQRLR